MKERLSELEQRLLKLPDMAIQYLGFGRMAINPEFNETAQRSARATQSQIFNRMDEGDKKALIDYIVWRNNQALKKKYGLR